MCVLPQTSSSQQQPNKRPPPPPLSFWTPKKVPTEIMKPQTPFVVCCVFGWDGRAVERHTHTNAKKKRPFVFPNRADFFRTRRLKNSFLSSQKEGGERDI